MNTRNKIIQPNSKSVGDNLDKSRSPEFPNAEGSFRRDSNDQGQLNTANANNNPDFSFNDDTDGLRIYGPMATKKKIQQPNPGALQV